MAANALELARNGVPKAPFYVTGRIGERAFSVHAEGERMILKREGQARHGGRSGRAGGRGVAAWSRWRRSCRPRRCPCRSARTVRRTATSGDDDLARRIALGCVFDGLAIRLNAPPAVAGRPRRYAMKNAFMNNASSPPSAAAATARPSTGVGDLAREHRATRQPRGPAIGGGDPWRSWPVCARRRRRLRHWASRVPRYYLWEQRALEGLVPACEPRPQGETVSEHRSRSWRRKSDATAAGLCPAAGPGAGLAADDRPGTLRRAPETVKPAKAAGKRPRKRRPVVRALKAAAAIAAAAADETAADVRLDRSASGSGTTRRAVSEPPAARPRHCRRQRRCT